MGKLPDWIGNFPFPPDKKKPIMAEFFLPSGGLSPRCSEAHSHQGDEAVYVCEGDLCVFFPDTKEALEVRPQAVIFIPEGVKHQYINYSDQVVKAVKAVAPGL